jgi:uncharacterized protein (TIGR00369 family)
MTAAPSSTAAAFATMTGRDLLQAVIDGHLKGASIADSLTFELVEVGEGFVAFEGETGPHLLNPAGMVHGGWALTLIDSAAGCAAHSTLPAGVGYSTLETKVNFVRPIAIDTGRVRCEGRVINPGRQIITAEGTVKDAAGRLLAHGTSTLMVLQPRG